MTKERKYEIKWILYDVGNSAFTLLVSTVLPIYFTYLYGGSSDTAKATEAAAVWGYAASIVTLCVALLGPTLGAMTDFKGMKRPFFFFSAVIGVLGCAALGIPMPWQVFLIVFIIAKIAYSASLIFYDSMLVDVADMKRVDNVSAQGYAFGYIGSCIPFIISIVLINFTPLSVAISMPIAFLLNAAWWLAFTGCLWQRAINQIHFVARTPHAVRENFKRLFSVFSKNSEVENKKGILLFLVCVFLLYRRRLYHYRHGDFVRNGVRL